MLPTPENEMEETIINIIKDGSLSNDEKIKYIKSIVEFNTNKNLAVNKACAICPQLPRESFLDDLFHFTVTIYLALPRTSLKDGTFSSAGHMWFQVENTTFKTQDSFGFAPLNTGITGAGSVTQDDTENYIDPFYSRTFEITLDQYNNLLDYGKSAKDNKNSNFDLYYKGLTNSCIDFTWKALKSAGIQPTNRYFNTYYENFEGKLKVKNNKKAVQSIEIPFPESLYNIEIVNEPPIKTIEYFMPWDWSAEKIQHMLLTNNDAIKPALS